MCVYVYLHQAEDKIIVFLYNKISINKLLDVDCFSNIYQKILEAIHKIRHVNFHFFGPPSLRHAA